MFENQFYNVLTRNRYMQVHDWDCKCSWNSFYPSLIMVAFKI